MNCINVSSEIRIVSFKDARWLETCFCMKMYLISVIVLINQLFILYICFNIFGAINKFV